MNICLKHFGVRSDACSKAEMEVDEMGGRSGGLVASPSPRHITVKMPWGEEIMLTPGRSQRRVRAPGLQGQRPFVLGGERKFMATSPGRGGMAGSGAEAGCAMRSFELVSTLMRTEVRAPRAVAGFTMVEIAICLAIIGLALVAIIGVLPLGMNVQRDNREETVINQDATVFMESIRNGVRAGFDLTNYVFLITNYVSQYGPGMVLQKKYANSYTYSGAVVDGVAVPTFGITNNARIIGLLSTPEYTTTDAGGNTIPAYYNLSTIPFNSNHVFAYVRAMSGPAVEKPPQNNSILLEDSFTYRMLVVNGPVETDTNLLALPAAQTEFSRQLLANLHELRLTFTWPVRPNFKIGSDGPPPQTQRTMVAGTYTRVQDGRQQLFYYQAQTFTNSP